MPNATNSLIASRGIRAFVDGLISVILPAYLINLGYSGFQVGALVTATLLGSAALTLAVGLRGFRQTPTRLLMWLTGLMALTGIGFATITWFWALFIIGAIGTMNPSSGDVSPFLPLEQSLLPLTTADKNRNVVFARYAMVASLIGAIGALAAGLPQFIANTYDVPVQAVDRYVFLLYALGGLFLFLGYRRLELPAIPIPSRTPLATSRHNVTRLSILFSIDAFGGGFVVQSMLVLWLGQRFTMSTTRIGSLLFVTGILSAFSILLAPKVAKRFGLVRTMVFTHIPASIFLIAAAFMPNAPLAIACLILRSLVSSMDVPARTSYVMAIVPANERAAAASVTNVPRSLAAALPPLATGAMLDHSNFGWPLLLAGIIKITYDLLLLFQFRSVRPPEEG